jgi:hypothetical protein
MTSRSVWVLAMALILCACGGDPAAPTPADTGDGITIFADPRFRGLSTIVLADIDDLDDLVGGCSHGTAVTFDFDFDDCISSIRIPAGRKLTAYEDPHYRGASVTFTSDVMMKSRRIAAAVIGLVIALRLVAQLAFAQVPTFHRGL